MNFRTRIFAGSAALSALLAVLAVLLFDKTFNTVSSLPTRVFVSIATAVFVVLCALATGAWFSAAYFFLRMVNSPQSGQTVFDARMLKGKSLFSERYLSEEGKKARSRLFQALRWFGGCWVGCFCIGLLAGWLVKIG
jgi:heme A synthase